jgi:predicted MFS family arabinose efflux permease
VCWPLSAYLVEHVGWRATCLVYAALWAAVALPLYLVALPRRRPEAATVGASVVATDSREARYGDGAIFVVLAMVLTISAAILATMGSHLVLILQARGLDLAGAVALGMLIGPSAVGARFIEMLAGSRYHPIWTMTASVGLVALGVCLFLTTSSMFAAAIVLYASGNGIGSIAKGTLPLALFGAQRYPALAGKLALPIMVAMALAPFVGAVAFQRGGATGTLLMLLALALSNVVLVGVLWVLSRGQR